MISERSCDTEDWSYDAENSTFHSGINYILMYIKIENSYFKLENYLLFLLNVLLVSIVFF